MNTMLPASLAERRDHVAGMVAGVVGAIVLVAMAARFLNHMPLYDELLHVLAARGLREHGTPLIADGVYSRARLFTWLVSLSMKGFGDTLVAARIPSLLACVVLVGVSSWWLTRRAGLLAGVVAGICLCVVPTTLDLAVFARFYTLHALLVLAVGLLAYEASESGRSWRERAVRIALAIVLLIPAVHLQVTTMIAVLGIVSGVVCAMALDRFEDVRRIVVTYPLRVIGGLLVLLACGLLVMVLLGFDEELRAAPIWAAGAAARPMYYLVKLADDMPLLWPLFPVAIVLAFGQHRRLTVFCVALFATVLVVHSLAGSKALRYIYYALPFFSIVWGCAVSAVLLSSPQVATSLSARSKRLVALAVAVLVLALSHEGQRAVRVAAGRATVKDALSYAGEADWSAAMPLLKPVAAETDRLVTSNAMKALFYLNRYDYELNVSIVAETDSGTEFGTDPRTGRQAIGTADSLLRVLDMDGMTLLVLEQEKIGNPVGVPTSVMGIVDARCQSVTVPERAGIRVWRCPGRTAAG